MRSAALTPSRLRKSKLTLPVINGASAGKDGAAGLQGGWGSVMSYVRADSKLTVFDHENVLRTCKVNEMPIEGARRVENHLSNGASFNSEDVATMNYSALAAFPTPTSISFSAGAGYAYFKIDVPTVDSEVYTARIKMSYSGSGTFVLRIAGVVADKITITGPVTEKIYSLSFTESTSLSSLYVGVENRSAHGADELAKTIDFITDFQVERKAGASDASVPSEYVSCRVPTNNELIPSPAFTQWTDPALPDGWDAFGTHTPSTNYVEENVNGLRLVCDGAAIGIQVSNFGMEIGQTYLLSLSIDSVASGDIKIGYTASANEISAKVGGVGSYTYLFTPTTASLYIVRWSGVTDLVISNFSVKSVSHGVNVDGVRCFTTTNGNSVVSNVVTEGVGTELTTVNGLLMNPALSNLCIYSDDLTTGWGNGGAPVITANDRESSRGVTILDKIANDGLISACGKILIASVASSTNYNLSGEIENVDSSLTRFGLFDGSTIWHGYIDIAWTAGVPSTSSSSGATNIRYEQIRGLLYRVSFNLTVTTALGTDAIHIHPDRNATAKSVWFGGCQLTSGFGPKPFVATNGGVVSAVASTYLTTEIAGVLLQDESTIFLDWIPKYDSATEQAASSHGLIAFTGLSTNGIYMHASLKSVVFYDGTTILSSASDATTRGVRQKVALKYHSNVMSLFIDGVKVDTDVYSGSFAASPTHIYINSANAHLYIVKGVRFYPIALSDDECLRLTA